MMLEVRSVQHIANMLFCHLFFTMKGSQFKI